MTKLSIIIPTFNEARGIRSLIESLKDDRSDSEIIVVDGGSSDRTRTIAQQAGAQVFSTEPSRGGQMRLGADRARGEILWFVHADSIVPPGAAGAIIAALEHDPNAAGGNFELLFGGGDDFATWLNGFYASIRAKGFYYGDSGVFVRTAVYHALGGFPDLQIMEDYAFNRKLERSGKTLCIADPPLITSSRRFHGRPKWSMIIEWSVIHILYHLGLPNPWLAKFYNTTRTYRNGRQARRTASTATHQHRA